MPIYTKSNAKRRSNAKEAPAFVYNPEADGEMDKLQELAQATHGKGWAKLTIKEQLALIAKRTAELKAAFDAGSEVETAQLFSARLSHRVEQDEEHRSVSLQFCFEADGPEANGLKKSLVSLPARYVLALATDEGLALLKEAAHVIAGYGHAMGKVSINPELVRSTWNAEGGPVAVRGANAGRVTGANELADDASIKAWLDTYKPRNA